MREPRDSIAVVDWECLSPVGLDAESTWKELSENRSGIDNLRRYDPEQQDLQGVASVAYGGELPLTYGELAGSDARFDKWPEPAFHGVQKVIGSLLEKISFDIDQHEPQRIAVLGGTALAGEISQEFLYQKRKADPKFILNQCQNMPLSVAASKFGLKGPSFSIGGACASAGHALFIACQLLRAGVIDSAIAVGFEFPLLPISVGGFEWLHALYRRDRQEDRAFLDAACASRPFSRDRRGFVLAEAVGAVLLSRPAHAAKLNWPVRAWIRGAYANSDAEHVTRISKDNIAVCMRGALRAAACQPEEIECVNAHATSTPVGDRAEMEALGEVFGDHLRTLPVVANKSQVGHSLGASPTMELILAARGMEEGTLLPTLNHIQDPSLPEAWIPPETTQHPHSVTLMDSFGFGGTNVCMVLERGGG